MLIDIYIIDIDKIKSNENFKLVNSNCLNAQ